MKNVLGFFVACFVMAEVQASEQLNEQVPNECIEKAKNYEINFAKVVGKNRGSDAGFLAVVFGYFAHSQLDISPIIYVPMLGLSSLVFAAGYEMSLDDQEKKYIESSKSFYTSHFTMGLLCGGLLTAGILKASADTMFDSPFCPKIARAFIGCMVGYKVIGACQMSIPA